MMTVNCIKRRRGRMGASYLRKEIKKYIRRRWNEMRPNVEWSSLSGCDAALQASATLLQTCPVTLPFVLLWCSCAMPDSGSVSVDNLCSCLFFFSFWKRTSATPTQHIKTRKEKGFHASAKYLTLRHFSHFAMKTFSGTGTRAVRGWKDIHQLASTRSDWAEILCGKEWSRACARITTNYIFNWGEKGDSAHSLHLSYIPVLYIPRILNCVQTRTTPACHHQHQHQQRRRDLCANHCHG